MSNVSCNSKSTNKNGTDITNNKLYVDFINVGKGDCILIRSAEGNYMIDTGYSNTSDKMLKYLNERNVTELEGLIITHFDKDHVGGASALIKKIDVKKIYVPDYEGEGNKYKTFLENVQKRGIQDRIQLVTSDLRIAAKKINISIYPAKKDQYDVENNYSMITKIVYNKNSFLFAADAEKDRLNEVLGSDEIQADVLKVPYHGIYGKRSLQFIDQVAPKYAVITCETKEDVSDKILDELGKINAETYLNCEGNIAMVSDGTGNISVTQK